MFDNHGQEDLSKVWKLAQNYIAKGMNEDNAFTEAYSECCNQDDY